MRTHIKRLKNSRHKKAVKIRNRKPIKNTLKCGCCPKTFKYSKSLQTHVKDCNGNKPKQDTSFPKCSSCNSTFTYLKSFKKHVKICNGNKPKQFPKCSGCNNTFTYLKSFEKHVKICNGIKPKHLA